MKALPVDYSVAFLSAPYLLLLLLVLLGRTADLFSTWVATPTLELEANPVARALGWRLGVAVNLFVAVAVALLPVAAISITTTSLLVAARNLQSAWLLRTTGEHQYRDWIADRYRETRRGVFLICLVLHAGLIASVGVGLVVFCDDRLIPFSVGVGIVTYAIAVAAFTGLSMHRAAHPPSSTLTSLLTFGADTKTSGPSQASAGIKTSVTHLR